VIISIKVFPSSGKQQWILDKSGQLKCYLKSQPEKGKANQELIKLLAKQLEIPQTNIQIISGATTRIKRLKIEGYKTVEQILNKLNLETGKQNALF
jgi:uncharacterized protein (TIGR00251 family)